jgi:heptaprenyl diphosphate synthase
MSTKRISLVGLFIAIALVLHIAEGMMPLPFIIPGARLGLANISTVIALYLLGKRDTFLIMVTRITLGSIFGGGFSAFLYSFTGSLFSFVMMALMTIAKDKVSPIGLSATGGFFHSLGQILVSMVLLSTPRMIIYLPGLSIVSVITGAFIGLVTIHVIGRLQSVAKQ